jgi:hypothetical protein
MKDILIDIEEYFCSRQDEYARLSSLSDDEFKKDLGAIVAAKDIGISVDFLLSSFERDIGE